MVVAIFECCDPQEARGSDLSLDILHNYRLYLSCNYYTDGLADSANCGLNDRPTDSKDRELIDSRN